MLNKIRKNKKGFSLVELIVVIAIMAVLAVILVPTLLQYVEKSRAQKDFSAMDEVTNAVKIAMADQDVYDEMLQYNVTLDDGGVPVGYAETTDENAAAWSTETMRGATITFTPNADNRKSIVTIGDGVMNAGAPDGKGGKGTELSDATMDDGEHNYMYGRLIDIVGEKIELNSQTYRNSAYTVFIKMGTLGSGEGVEIYGQWGGTNLPKDGVANPGGGNVGDDNTDTTTLEPGLYDANDVRLASWDELTNDYGFDVELDYGSSSYMGNTKMMMNYSYKDELKAGVKLIVGDVEKIGDYGFHYCGSLTTIVLPETLISIGEAAFMDCHSLTSINIPDGVTSIGNYAFRECKNLESITIPGSVNSLGEQMFVCYSSNLKQVTILDGVTSIDDSAFYACDSLTSITIPNSVTNIGKTAFYACDSLTSITIPNSVTNIGQNAFHGCTNLTSIEIPNNVTSIGSQAFRECDKLTNIIIPDGVTKIDSQTFMSCDNLTSIEIPNSVTEIGSCVFEYCTNLTDITFKGTAAQWSEISLNPNWYKDLDGKISIAATKVICSDGVVCVVCSGGTATCQDKAICDTCGNKYGELGECSLIDGSCQICGKAITVIETEHNPYPASQNYVVLGTWDYSDATSIDITITYQTFSTSSDWCSITEGIDYVAGSSYSATRKYLNTSGSVVSAKGTDSSVKFGGKTQATKTFSNVNMLTGSVVFYASQYYSKDYYGITVTVTPNY